MIAARHLLLAGAASALAALQGCAHAPQPMYAWGTFPHYQYDALRGDGQSPADQIAAMEQQAQKAAADHAALPPGFRAHLGKLYYDAGDTRRAAALWTAEKNAFPESAPYMDSLLRRLDTTKTGGQA